MEAKTVDKAVSGSRSKGQFGAINARHCVGMLRNTLATVCKPTRSWISVYGN